MDAMVDVAEVEGAVLDDPVEADVVMVVGIGVVGVATAAADTDSAAVAATVAAEVLPLVVATTGMAVASSLVTTLALPLVTWPRPIPKVPRGRWCKARSGFTLLPIDIVPPLSELPPPQALNADTMDTDSTVSLARRAAPVGRMDG
jgi:hypothetical protein